jgi:hypothetical protein
MTTIAKTPDVAASVKVSKFRFGGPHRAVALV